MCKACEIIDEEIKKLNKYFKIFNNISNDRNANLRLNSVSLIR